MTPFTRSVSAVALVVMLVATSICFAEPPAAQALPERELLEQQRIQTEIEKLKLEIDELKTTSEATGVNAKRWIPWLTALGGTLATLLVALAGVFIDRNQRRKLAQDRELEREKHYLEVFTNLGDPESPRVRLGAVAILAERIKSLHNSQGDDGFSQNVSTLVSILIAATKHEEDEVILKFIADKLVDALGAGEGSTNEVSPLSRHDFQGAKLDGAWWRGVDARKVDFYRASLKHAGLRRARMSGAVLKGANLSGATLVDADLTSANLEDANLTGADLRGADLTGAVTRGIVLTGAKLEGVKGYVSTPV